LRSGLYHRHGNQSVLRHHLLELDLLGDLSGLPCGLCVDDGLVEVRDQGESRNGFLFLSAKSTCSITKGGAIMVTFFILLLVAIAAVVVVLLAVGASGIVFIIVFGDLLIGGAIIYLIIRAILKK